MVKKIFMVDCESDYTEIQEKNRTIGDIGEERFLFKQNFTVECFLKEKMHYSHHDRLNTLSASFWVEPGSNISYNMNL